MISWIDTFIWVINLMFFVMFVDQGCVPEMIQLIVILCSLVQTFRLVAIYSSKKN